MARLKILESARSDLKAIFDYFLAESASIATARHFVGILRRKCEHLAALPGEMGRPRPALGANMKSFAFRGYVILFRYAENSLEVIRILEGHRDIEHQFQEPDGPEPPR